MPNYIHKIVEDLTAEMPGKPKELIDLYAMLAFTHGTWTNMEDVHDAWSIWQNRINPNHRSLVPFHELPPEIQEYDRKYMEIIHKVVRNYVHQGVDSSV